MITGSRSGSGTGDVSELEASLKEYSFLTWLSPYVQPRKTNSNFPDDRRQKENDRIDDESGLESDSIYTDDEYGQTEVDADVENEALSPAVVVKPDKGQKASAKKNKKAEIEYPAKKYKQSDLMESEVEMMQSVSKVMNQRLEKPKPLPAAESVSTDEIFGKMIASELKQLPNHIKIQAKHELIM